MIITLQRDIIKTVKGGEKMDEKTFTLVSAITSAIGMAIAVSKEVRAWYKEIKKEKRNKPMYRKHRK